VRALLGLALGRSGGDQVADALIRDLAHPSRTVRLAAVQALDRLGAPVAGGGLLRSALDPDVHVASLARGALGRLPEEAFHFVATEWEWLDPRQRADAIAVLATLEGERPVRFLRERLRDPSPLVALAAARELARRGDASGRTVALERLGSDDPVIARTARQVLDALEAGP
jgi:HEAT repeat protein